MQCSLVTGGAGFIGGHLVRLLLEQGRGVRVLERPNARVDHLPLAKIELIRADIRDRVAVDKAVRGCDAVFHLAANPNLWTHKRGHFHQVNFVGAVNVLEASLAAGVRRILHTSTESILTKQSQTGPIAEDVVVRPGDVIGPYCRSKYAAEVYALRLARAGAPIVVVNPTLPTGPGDFGRSPPTQMMLDFCRGRRREYLGANLNLIDVRDVALGMVQALDHGKPGRRYLLSHENVSIREIFRRLSKLTGIPEPSWKVPYALALTVAYLSEFIADIATRRSPAATVTGVKLTQRTMHFDSSQSLAELNLQPRSIEDSLADSVSWFREQGWLDKRYRKAA